MDPKRVDGESVHGSNKSSVTNLTSGVISSNEIENVSTILDWSSLVIEPEDDGGEEGVPDEKPVDENAMFTLLGLKKEVDERETKPGPIAVPTPAYDLHDTKGVAMDVDDKAPEEPLIAWNERHPKMDIGTPYPDMAAFRKAIKQFAINGEFEYGTKKNEPARFSAFCKGQSIINEPCKWSLTASWQRDENCVMVMKNQTEHICSSTSGKVTSMTTQSWVADKAAAMLKKDPTIGAVKLLKELQEEHHVTLDYHTVWKGKQKAATSLYGSWEESFRMLYNYKAEIELRSPGSIVEIDTTTVKGIMLPFVIHQLNAKTRGLGHLKVKASADSTAEVKNVTKEDERHVVKTLTHECTCLQWQHTGKPCDHALAFINVLQARHFVNMENYVHEYYSVSRFRAAYEGVIEPLTDKNQWPQVDTGFVLRPPIPKGNKRGAGRTRKQRMKSWCEGGSRKGSLNICKKCSEVGHREAGCPKNGTKKRKSRGKKNPSPWFDVSVSNAVPSTPTKSNNAATCSSPGAVTRSQTASQASPGPVTRSQAASLAGTPPPKSPAKGKKKKMIPKRRKLSDM